MPKVEDPADNILLEVEDGYLLVNLGEEAHTSILFGCRDGACGSCLITVIEGAANLTPMSDAERGLLDSMCAEPNERLACQCQVIGDVKITASE